VILAIALTLLTPPSAVHITVPRIQEPVAIDGALDESAWAAATVREDFLATRPVEGREPSQVTRVRVMRDDERLYVAFEAMDLEPSGIRAKLSDRDAIFEDDFVGVVLDPFQDFRRAFILLVNPLGAQADCVFIEGAFGDDCTWDVVFSSAGKLHADGYTVEIALPFKNIRFDPGRDTWNFQLLRVIARQSEQITIPERRAAAGSPTRQVGTMSGMLGIDAGVSVTLIPEVTTSVAEKPEGSGTVLDGDVGVTAKLSRPNAALDIALNPDFSQVESDAARISFNERFALYFDEKRPFFLEGRELFVTPWEVVYTRSIVEPLYGLKLTGKSGPTSFAVLHALDESPAASTLDERWHPDAYRKQPAITTVGRMATDVASNATLGMLMTDKHVGRSWNRVGGMDGSLQPASDLRFAAQVLGSATDHPDGEYESGSAAKLRFIRSGRHFNWFSWYEQLTSGFRAEAGFIRRTGYREVGMQPSFRLETGRKTGLLTVEIEPTVTVLNQIGGSDRERYGSLNTSLSFPTAYIESSLFTGVERFRGERFERSRSNLAFSVNPVRWFTFDGSVAGGEAVAYFADDPYLGGRAVTTVGVGVRPSERLSIGLTATRSIFSNDAPADAFRQLGDRSGKEIEFDATVGRVTSQLFFTRSISLRVIADWNGVEDRVAPSVLLGWRPGPGTVVYAGWQDEYATDRGEDPRGRQAAFMKLSYLFGSAG